MNIFQMFILLLGIISVFLVLTQFRKRYIILSRSTVKVAMFSAGSARKTKKVSKILLDLIFPINYQEINLDTDQETLKKILISREVVKYGLYCLMITFFTFGLYFFMSGRN